MILKRDKINYYKGEHTSIVHLFNGFEDDVEYGVLEKVMKAIFDPVFRNNDQVDIYDSIDEFIEIKFMRIRGIRYNVYVS